jgi:DNA-binding SARP family transcriptional activator
MSEFSFGVLGSLEFAVDGTVVPLGTPKQRAVLALLVLNRNRAVAMDSLIDAAWDQSPPAGGRATVHSYVSNLRRLMNSVGVDSRAVLTSAPPGYRLCLSDDQCDLAAFNAEKAAGLRAAADGQFEPAAGHLAAAVALWRGPVLDDLREFSFVEAFASALAEDRMIVHTAYAEAEIANGRAYSVIGELESLTVAHPYREPLWAQLITAYYMSDRQSDAFDAYHRLRANLTDDLGVDPGPKARDLYERMLHQQPLDGPRAAQASAQEATLCLEDHTGNAEGPAVAVLRDAAGERHPVLGAATRIGRSPDNDIVLSNSKVSRQHAVIIDTGTGFVITDLRSANGVYVSGRRTHVSTAIRDGDRIHIGDHRLTFEYTPVKRVDEN